MVTIQKLSRLKKILRSYPGAVVAFSGGVDSTFLLKAAKDTLGDKVIAVTVVSAIHPKTEISAAKKIARRLKCKHLVVRMNVLEDKNIRYNQRTRCFHCKLALFRRIKQIAKEYGYVVIEATNKSDLRDYRPGIKALKKLQIESPLMKAGFKKDDIRKSARRSGLPNWNLPSMACLASRIPYGREITPEALRRIDAAEEYLRKRGIRQVRVRDHYPIARIEVEQFDVKWMINNRRKVTAHLTKLGYKYITLDLAGYSTGSLNR